MASEYFHRDSCKRLHRIVANYLAVQAWTGQLDCLVLDRQDLEHFLQLERFKSSRVEWLQEDMRPWFPHQAAFYRSGSPSSIHSLFLSRVPIEEHLSSETMTTPERIALMAHDAPPTALYSSWRPKRPTEEEMIAELTFFSNGLRVPLRVSAKKPKKKVATRKKVRQ